MSNPIDFTELSYEIPAFVITHQEKKKVIPNSCVTTCKGSKCSRCRGTTTADSEDCKYVALQSDILIQKK